MTGAFAPAVPRCPLAGRRRPDRMRSCPGFRSEAVSFPVDIGIIDVGGAVATAVSCGHLRAAQGTRGYHPSCGHPGGLPRVGDGRRVSAALVA